MTGHLGVVGAGLMGAGLAEVAARRGSDVVVVDLEATALECGRRRVLSSLERAAESGRLQGAGNADVESRIRWSTTLDDLADRDVVIEAIIEKHEAKAEVFTRLGAIVSPGTVLATNTSSLPVTPLAVCTAHPERVLGLHFFNPVPQMPLVEVATTVLTSQEAADRAEAFVTGPLGKQAIRTIDRAGFVVNRLLVPFLMSAVRMHESGPASAEDIDLGLRLGAGHPMGPLALLDLIGLDTVTLVADALYAEHRDPACLPPPSLRRMVEAGWTGRKSGRGFYAYPPPADRPPPTRQTTPASAPEPETP